MARNRKAPFGGGSGFSRGPRIADLMTDEYHQFFLSSQAAERAGDAAAALEYHRGIPMFTRSGHVALMSQLAGLAEEMTPWMWARWAAYQCTRAEDPGSESMLILRSALDYTLRIFYAEELHERFVNGGDPVPLIAQVCGEDWVFHQLCTFELGGLFMFRSSLATDRLRDETRLCRQWFGARMGGYRVESSDPGTFVVRDLRRDESVRLLDLGARVHADPDGWLIGRLVPSGIEELPMFDTRPLPVDEQTAREVASATSPGMWVSALRLAIDDGRVDRTLLQSEDRELVTDVPSLSLVRAGTPSSALDHTLAALARGRDEVGRAALRILRSAGRGELDDDRAAYVAAAVLQPHAHTEVRARVLAPGQEGAWTHWADLVPEPARSRLRRLATLTGPQAA
jgi:hypothetical protein